MAEQVVEVEGGFDTEVGTVVSSWEFRDAPPSPEEVAMRLRELEPLYGLKWVDFIEYVQPLPSDKNVSLVKGQKDYKTVWTLYFTVAGRIAMLNRAAELNGWRVDFIPEPNTPTGVPGFLEMTDRIVYREYVEIWAGKKDGHESLIGRRPGMAWVPREGGSGAVGSNRYEKVETSARGRALAAWGFGVLPGSGVASLDEMLTVPQLRAARDTRATQDAARRAPKPREEIEGEVRLALEDWRLTAGLEEQAITERAFEYAQKTFNKQLPVDENDALQFTPLKDGELIMMLRSIRNSLAKAKADKAELT